MIRYLLDSNILSEPARQQPDPKVVARVRAHKRESAMASVVWLELLYGLERAPVGRKRTYLAHYLHDVVRPSTPIFPFGTAAAEWLAREKARLVSIGQPRPTSDGMIAAVAATRGLVLVTRNTADFEGYDGLTVENWFED